MAHDVEHGPSSATEINPKIASDIKYWSHELGVSGDDLHEAIRIHGGKLDHVKAALAKDHMGGQHQKKGEVD